MTYHDDDFCLPLLQTVVYIREPYYLPLFQYKKLLNSTKKLLYFLIILIYLSFISLFYDTKP